MIKRSLLANLCVSYNAGSLHQLDDDHWGPGQGEEEIERKKKDPRSIAMV
jgi:hypothetical protein